MRIPVCYLLSFTYIDRSKVYVVEYKLGEHWGELVRSLASVSIWVHVAQNTPIHPLQNNLSVSTRIET